MTTYLKFADQAEARAAFTQWLVEDEMPVYIGRTAVDVVGTIQRPTGEVLQTEHGEVPVFAPIPGWHINLSNSVPELAQFEIPEPDVPARIFAGSETRPQES